MSKNLVIGNWKMNPETFEAAQELAKKIRVASAKLANTDVVVCPPFPFISAAVAKSQSDHFHLGAQSVSVFENGSHTGEVGTQMLASLGVEYVIVGHSDERTAGDTDTLISARILRVVEAGLTAVVCVGENTRSEDGEHLEFLQKQMITIFAGVSQDKVRKIVVAYEPVWAIGAKAAMHPEQIYEMSLFVRKVFSDIFGQEAGRKVKIIYGGSTNATNAGEIMRVGKVDGILVGRESINPDSYAEMLRIVDSI